MDPVEYIKSKQIQWWRKRNKDKELIGSEGNRGRKAYTTKLKYNLFRPLLDVVEKAYKEADGVELKGDPCDMQALHSSEALTVNVFQYWKEKKKPSKIAAECKFCNRNNKVSEDIKFQGKYPISNEFRYSPNIDLVFENYEEHNYDVFAIESKFKEPYEEYDPRKKGLSSKYIELEGIWDDMPNLRQFAKRISPWNFSEYLDSTQLVRHILGLKKEYGKNNFRLLYLWYDTIGAESEKHIREINEFSKVVEKDGIKFKDMSYQELIIRLAKEYREDHAEYIDYITDRYL